MQNLSIYIFGAVGVLVGLIVMFVLPKKKLNEEQIKRETEKVVEDAKNNGQQKIEAAKIKAAEVDKRAEEMDVRFHEQIKKHEQFLVTKEEAFNRRQERATHMRDIMKSEEQTIEELKLEKDKVAVEIEEKLLTKTGMHRNTAKEDIIAENKSRFEDGREERITRYENHVKEDAIRDARSILAGAIYRYSAHASATEQRGEEVTVENDAMKGKIVGKDGRNIIFFENLFEVTVVFNDMPHTITISSFNLVNREKAKLAMNWLLKKREIDENVIKASKEYSDNEIERVLEKAGEKVCQKLGLEKISQELKRIIGRLQFRTSYGQNILRHCYEVAYFSRMIAAETGMDEKTAFLAGFFHDLGKAIDQEVEGSHDALTKELLEKYNFSWEVVHAAWAHHDAIPQETPEAMAVKAADGLSASRPGARAESLAKYIERMKLLEATAMSFEGVKKAFTMFAGREVRAHLDPQMADDERTHKLAVDIAAQIQEQGGYPGKIKVVTVRRTKSTDYVKAA